jgi:dihydrodipicolinate synthase/N-acetylneuraminate lyase
MSRKILASLLVVLGLLGLGYAWGGFINSPAAAELPEEVKEKFNAAFEEKDFETLQALHKEYMPHPGHMTELDEETQEKIRTLRKRMYEAMVAGDFEELRELRAELSELMPRCFLATQQYQGEQHHKRKDYNPCNCPISELDDTKEKEIRPLINDIYEAIAEKDFQEVKKLKQELKDMLPDGARLVPSYKGGMGIVLPCECSYTD